GQHASTPDADSVQVKAINPNRDDERTSTADLAPSQVDAMNPIRGEQHALAGPNLGIGGHYVSTADTSALREETPILILGGEDLTDLNLQSSLLKGSGLMIAEDSSSSTEDPQMMRQIIDLMKWTMGAYGRRDLSIDAVTHRDQIFSRRGSAAHLVSKLPSNNRITLDQLDASQKFEYSDSIKRDVQFFTKIHWWKGIPTRILHAAVGLMDLYTWLRPITHQDYHLLALGAITTAIRMRSPKIKMNCLDLCTLTNHVYTQGQITLMEETLRKCVGNRINFPTPHTFFDFYLFGLIEFTAPMLDWTKQACNYIFELGLCEDYLCRSSASLRCAAVLYLIRRILQL
ncbi:hypothetical protein TSMEX_011531, partial [Taenia solium]